VPPASGRLTGADTGPGRLPEPEVLFAICERELARAERGHRDDGVAPTGPAHLSSGADLAGRRVVVTAGGTREPLDPVRFLGNRSSGKQGVALAAAAACRGAQVTLVLAHGEVPPPPDVEVVRVGTAVELEAATREAAAQADVVVMAAAVADFRPAHYASEKIKKSHDPTSSDAPTIELVRNPDILAGLVSERGSGQRPLIVGFAAETGDAQGSVLDHARSKLAHKGCDLLVVNEVGVDKTFGRDDNTVLILRRGTPEPMAEIGPAAKDVVAHAVLDAVVDALQRP
jgi:phosphopantothenoylcysteine decarboxylase / phosphopantothenate---cysteine ligase